MKQSAICDHLLQCNCAMNMDDFNNLVVDFNNIKLFLKKSLLIKRCKPILNRTIKPFWLKLFDQDDSLVSTMTWFLDFLLILIVIFLRVLTELVYVLISKDKGKRQCSFANALVEKRKSPKEKKI